ncbi:hypothetical protein [Vibrio phage BONAISHI]|nr:hypothetical protein [Vibrio phage BONAISHI]
MRRLGEDIPVSIGTAVPLEKHVTQVGANKQVDAIVLNLRTLWRNFSGSYEGVHVLDPAKHIQEFITETKQVVDLIQSDGIIAGIYYPDYSSIMRMRTGMIYKDEQMQTDRQKLEKALEDKACQLSYKAVNAFQMRVQLPPIEKRVWMLTHTGIDLLNRNRFLNLQLLESHSGGLKGPADWITKITNNEDYMRIPFNLLSLSVFGDGKYLKGWPLRYRKMLKRIAEANNWTPMTTNQKIVANLRRDQVDPKMSEEMIAMIQATVT